MKSKVLSLILAVCTLCSLLVSPASAVGGDSAVQMVQALGILDGTDLESPVTRAEFSKMLVAASSYKDSVSSEGSGYSLFRDVKSSYWASEYIRCAVSEGWMTGYTDGTFRPDETVKLEEACAAVLKLLGYEAINGLAMMAVSTGPAGRDQPEAGRHYGPAGLRCTFLQFDDS